MKNGLGADERKERVINASKWARLIVALIGLVGVFAGFIQQYRSGATEVPVNHIGSVVFALFALLLGFEYRVAGKKSSVSMFLMLYGIIMFFVTVYSYIR